jgi:1-pyrroline-4-hydroxy-2-carboxylate deaminase
MNSTTWTGVFPAVNTQLHQDQSLDLAASARHWEAQIEVGVSGLIVCGSLGENQCLQPDEKRTVVKHAVEVAAGRVPVVSGVAEMNTQAAIRYMQDCEKLGASGFMIMPPMVYKGDARETQQWFRTLAKATPLSWMLYNNPRRLPHRCHAGDVRRARRRPEPARHQRKQRQHPPHHGIAQSCRQSLPDFHGGG